MHPPAQQFAQCPLIERGHPERGDEVAADELGEHARVDAVGLAGQRCDRLDLARVRDLDDPARLLEAVTDPRSTAHHLQAAAHVRAQPRDQPRQAVLVGRDRALDRDLTALIERAPGRLARPPIDAEILHVGLLRLGALP